MEKELIEGLRNNGFSEDFITDVEKGYVEYDCFEGTNLEGYVLDQYRYDIKTMLKENSKSNRLYDKLAYEFEFLLAKADKKLLMPILKKQYIDMNLFCECFLEVGDCVYRFNSERY